MASEMIERVATAIHDMVTSREFTSYDDAARAAIKAMRQYTPDMIDAGLSAVSDSTVREPKATAWDAIRFHKAAIDAALAEE